MPLFTGRGPRYSSYLYNFLQKEGFISHTETEQLLHNVSSLVSAIGASTDLPYEPTQRYTAIELSSDLHRFGSQQYHARMRFFLGAYTSL